MTRWYVMLILLVLSLAVTPAAGQELFPDRCAGTWTGMMHLYSRNQLRDSVQVRMTVTKLTDSAWTWRMDYLNAKQPMSKDYVFRLKDRSTNRFVTDEGDGIILDESVFGNKAFSVFEVQGNILTASYELLDESLIFEVTSGKKTSESAAVISHPVTSLQRAILRRQPAVQGAR